MKPNDLSPMKGVVKHELLHFPVGSTTPMIPDQKGEADGHKLSRVPVFAFAQMAGALAKLGRVEEAKKALADAKLLDSGALVCVEIEVGQGEYRGGDQLWMRQVSPDATAQLINRDVLAPRSGGRFAFGRLIDRQGNFVGLLPPGIGQRQIVIDSPAWLAVAEMLVRKL